VAVREGRGGDRQVVGTHLVARGPQARVELGVDPSDDQVVSRNRIEPRSSRIAVVVVEQATEPFPPEHPSVLVRRRRRALEQHIVETLVVPLTMVVGEVLADGPVLATMVIHAKRRRNFVGGPR
jgi:hypothetical protein